MPASGSHRSTHRAAERQRSRLRGENRGCEFLGVVCADSVFPAAEESFGSLPCPLQYSPRDAPSVPSGRRTVKKRPAR